MHEPQVQDSRCFGLLRSRRRTLNTGIAVLMKSVLGSRPINPLSSQRATPLAQCLHHEAPGTRLRIIGLHWTVLCRSESYEQHHRPKAWQSRCFEYSLQAIAWNRRREVTQLISSCDDASLGSHGSDFHDELLVANFWMMLAFSMPGPTSVQACN